MYSRQKFASSRLGEVADRLLHAGRRHAAARVAGALRAVVGERPVEVAVRAQELPQPLPIVGVETGVEGARGDRLRQQLGQEAAGVRHELAIADRPAAERGVVVDPGVAVLVDEDLERDVELAAVVQQARVRAGNPRRAGVEVQVRLVVEVADLPGAQLVDDVAAPQREAASPRTVGGLQDGAAVARPAKLVRRGQPRDAGADDDDVPRPAAGRTKVELTGPGGRRQQPQGGGRGVHGGRPAGRADRVEQLATRDAPVHRCLFRPTVHYSPIARTPSDAAGGDTGSRAAVAAMLPTGCFDWPPPPDGLDCRCRRCMLPTGCFDGLGRRFQPAQPSCRRCYPTQQPAGRGGCTP